MIPHGDPGHRPSATCLSCARERRAHRAQVDSIRHRQFIERTTPADAEETIDVAYSAIECDGCDEAFLGVGVMPDGSGVGVTRHEPGCPRRGRDFKEETE